MFDVTPVFQEIYKCSISLGVCDTDSSTEVRYLNTMEHSKSPSLPAKISGSKVWFGQQFADKPELYVQHLSQSDIRELEDAANHFECRSICLINVDSHGSDVDIALNLARGQVTPDTFPLSIDLARRLRRITEDVYDGKGFSVLRGIDTLRYSEDTRVIMFAGLTSYVASDRANNIGKTTSVILEEFANSTRSHS